MARFKAREKNGVRLSVRYSHIIGITTVVLILIRYLCLSNIFNDEYTLSMHDASSSGDNSQSVIPRDIPGNTLLSDLLGVETAILWENICTEGGNVARNNQGSDAPPVVAIEVGMFKNKQCYFAAYQGMDAHCIEPSPKNYERVLKSINWRKTIDPDKKARAVVEHLYLYNMAAGNETGGTVPFYGSGGTGDHIGEFDAWNMVKGLDAEKSYKRKKKSRRTDVPMIKVDDIISNRIIPTNRKEDDQPNPKIQDVFILKIDTQGFESAVFSGLVESIAMKKIHFILFEYWPRGMDLLSSSDTKCAESVAILKQLDAAKYKLYALSVEAHPEAGKAREKMNDIDNGRPLDSFEANCNWYYEFEKRFPNANYKMGYWSDILAVSPDAKLSDPVTSIGEILAKNL